MRNLEQQTPRTAGQRLRDEPTARRLDTVTPRATRWLWPGRVALGQVTLVAGEPGAGTSLFLMNLASRVSRGRALPGIDISPAKSGCAAARPDLELPGGLRQGLSLFQHGVDA